MCENRCDMEYRAATSGCQPLTETECNVEPTGECLLMGCLNDKCSQGKVNVSKDYTICHECAVDKPLRALNGHCYALGACPAGTEEFMEEGRNEGWCACAPGQIITVDYSDRSMTCDVPATAECRAQFLGVGSEPHECLSCEDGFYSTQVIIHGVPSQACVPVPNIPRCARVDTTFNGFNCEECEEGYFKTETKQCVPCEAKGCTKCQSEPMYKKTSDTEPSTCELQFMCEECREGYIRLADGSGCALIDYCYPNNNDTEVFYQPRKDFVNNSVSSDMCSKYSILIY
jgi:hypothetical protein